MRMMAARLTRHPNGASERARGQLQPAIRTSAQYGMPAALLNLQRLAGNRATRQFVQHARDGHTGGADASGGPPHHDWDEATRLGTPPAASRPLEPFGRGLMGTRSSTAAVDRRCPLAGPCPDDPLADHGGAASTTCYTNTGRMRTTNLVEHCAGDCVAQHEAVHHVDRGECCTRVKRCRDLAGGDTVKEAACNEIFDAWYPRLSDWTECNAYRTEIACLKSLIDNRCDPSEGLKETAFDIVFGVSSGCCDELKGELAVATQREKSSCAAAVEAPCPFRSDGTR
jgi:hypothetical protein